MFFIKSKHIKLHLFMSRGVLREGRWLSIAFKPQRLLKPTPLKKKIPEFAPACFILYG